ncbi:Uncharacterised protein [Mycobacteroides abscessus]|nr:Uncharacterised protein [Mycobacteroides abscessus]
MLGELGRLAPGDVEQHGDGRGVVGVGGEDLEHLDPRGVREAPEELGLDAVEGGGLVGAGGAVVGSGWAGHGSSGLRDDGLRNPSNHGERRPAARPG